MRSACFLPAGRSSVIKPEFRDGVSFQYHNLVQHPFPSLLHNLFAFDVILNREKDATRQAFTAPEFSYWLRPSNAVPPSSDDGRSVP